MKRLLKSIRPRLLPKSLRARLMVSFLALSFLPILVLGILTYRNSRASLEEEIVNKLSAVADNKRYTLKGWLQIQTMDIENIAVHAAVKELLLQKGAEEKVKTLIASQHQTNPFYLDVLIADAGGKIVTSSSPQLGQTGKSFAEIGLPALAKQRTFISPVFHSPLAQQPVYLVVAPVNDIDKVLGYVAFEVEFGRIQGLFDERSGLGKTGEIMLVDSKYRMLSQSRFSKESTNFQKISEVPLLRLGFQGKRGEGFFTDYRGVKTVGAFRPVAELDAVLIAKLDEAEAMASVTRLWSQVLAILIVTMVASALGSWALARSTSQPIYQGVGFAHRVSQGDLTVILSSDSTSEINLLVESLNKMVGDLKEIVERIREVAQSNSTAASQISVVLESHDEIIASQAASINEITTTMQELSQSSDQVGKTAEEMAVHWKETLRVTEDGNQAVHKGIEEMNIIRSKAEGITQNILNLSEQVQRISSIVHTVSNIAEQTNMLALNAGIEAARAGEHGKGFAVVATEVRKLADQSQKAAGQITAIIQEIQAASHGAILAMEEGNKGLEGGIQQVLQAAETLQSVTSTIKGTVESAQEITLATRQQAIGVDQVTEAMRSIDQAMKETVVGAKQANTAASQLVHLGHSLQQLILRFQVGDNGKPAL